MGGRGSSFNASNDWKEAYDFFGVYAQGGSMYSDWASTLSYDEKKALVRYTGSSFMGINDSLRKDYDDPFYHQTIVDMDAAIEKFELKKDLMVYRGSSADLIGGYETAKEINANLKGAVVRDKGFTSTSAVVGGNFSDTIKYEIKVPKGKGRGVFVAPISLYGSENEFILKRGTNFLIQGARTDANGQVIVKLKVID